MMKIHTELAGFYRFDAVRLDAEGNVLSRRVVADWFPNLITDAGLEDMGTLSTYLTYCQVGAGNTAPQVEDTALVSLVAATSTINTTEAACASSSPYYTYRRNTYRFAEGVATGNLSEVSVGKAASGGAFSRALILDGNGDPTTIQILSDETLDVTYELRYYPKVTDDTGQTTLSGNIGGEYNWTMRAARVTNYATSGGWSIAQGGTQQGYALSASSYSAYNGEIGDITSAPSGTSGAASAVSVSAYEANSKQRKFVVSWGFNNGNLSGGIRSLIARMGIGYFQFRFGKVADDSPILKTSSDTLSLTLYHSWGRKP